HNGVSTLVLGRTRERPLARMFNRTLTQQLIQRGAHYEITIISTTACRPWCWAGPANVHWHGCSTAP
ncbi:hypothetical protein C7E12_22655, partial [Stenotrophomonas maltophilia]